MSTREILQEITGLYCRTCKSMSRASSGAYGSHTQSRHLGTETVQRAPRALKSIHNIKSCHSFPVDNQLVSTHTTINDITNLLACSV